jgi:hypothetical protein
MLMSMLLLPIPAGCWCSTPCMWWPQHSAAYTAILVNHDQGRSKLQSYDSYLPLGNAPWLTIERGDTQGEQHTDFLFSHPSGIINIQGTGPDLLYEAAVGGATARFRSLSGSTPWSDGECTAVRPTGWQLAKAQFMA